MSCCCLFLRLLAAIDNAGFCIEPHGERAVYGTFLGETMTNYSWSRPWL
jgi:hypothetical protein